MKDQITSMDIDVYETYPGALVRATPPLEEVYSKRQKTASPELIKAVKSLLEGVTLEDEPRNMHQIDSLLAWHSGYRHLHGKAIEIGDPKEGIISLQHTNYNPKKNEVKELRLLKELSSDFLLIYSIQTN